MKLRCPDPSEPPLLSNGLWNPVWYEYFAALAKLRLIDLTDVDVSSLANGDSPVYNSTTKKFDFVAN